HGVPNLARSSLLVTPTRQTTDGNATIDVMVTVLDVYGAAVNASPVTFTGTGANLVWNAATVPTNTSGQAQAQLRTVLAQTLSISATTAAATLSATVTFTAGVPARLFLVPDFSSQPADGN